MKIIFLILFLCFGQISPSEASGTGIVIKKKTANVTIKRHPKNPPQKSVLPEITPMPFHIPEIQRIVTDNGVEAWLIQEPSTPVIAVSILFNGGAASDPERLTGLSSLAVSLLDEGAGRLNAEKFQEILAEKAINMSFNNGPDNISVDMTTLADNKEKAFELLNTVLTKPRFDRRAVRRVKEQMYAAIESRKGQPTSLVYERWLKQVYKNHPYSRLLPTKSGIRGITRANLKGLVRNRFTKDNMYIGVVGNISAEELKPLLETAFANMPDISHVREVPPYTPELSPRIDVLSMDVPQSAVRFGHRGIARNDPDFYTALLVNYTFGSGGFASRLFKEVREKNGLAYSVGANLSTIKASPMIIGTAGSDNAKMAAAIDIIKAEWKKMEEYGPTEKELKDAKTYLTGSFPLTFSESSGLASFLAGMQYNDLGIDYLNRRNDIMNSVTLEQAQAVARRLFLPDNLFFVVVGKPANL